MKAISLWQPWATLMADAEKRWETRSRQIRYRGWIAICAAQTREHMIIYRRVFPFRERLKANGYDENKDLPLGCVVAIGRVTDCITTSDWMRLHCKTPNKPKDDREYCFGNYEPGRFAWKIEDIRKLKEPLPIRGRQFIWTLTDGEEAECLRRISGARP